MFCRTNTGGQEKALRPRGLQRSRGLGSGGQASLKAEAGAGVLKDVAVCPRIADGNVAPEHWGMDEEAGQQQEGGMQQRGRVVWGADRRDLRLEQFSFWWQVVSVPELSRQCPPSDPLEYCSCDRVL